MRKSILAIIPAIENPSNKILINSNLPDAMTPINGKPVIGYIIEDLLERRIQTVIVILNRLDQVTEKYVLKKYKTKIKINIVYNEEPFKGVGHAIYLAITQSPQVDSYFVYSSDTIYKGELNFSESFLVTSRQYEESNKWIFVETKEGKHIFIDKREGCNNPGNVVCGLYYFSNAMLLREITTKKQKMDLCLEIKDILQLYSESVGFQLEEANQWYDCGNIKNYYKAKIDFLKIRTFNHIEYNEIYGYITKTSDNKHKILDEINWYKNTPEKLKLFAPRLINYAINKKSAWYATEYYGYPSLADLFVFESLDLNVWKMIISRLFEIIAIFQKEKNPVNSQLYYKMYYEKTVERLSSLRLDTYWNQVLAKENIIINGKTYKNIDVLIPAIEKKINSLIDVNEMCFIHGDLCMGNILFDYSSMLFKFIDPRGNFGKTSVYGDIKYDVAKLRHSFCSYYDFIVSDLFEVQEDEYSFDFTIYVDEKCKDISTFFDREIANKGFDLTKIKLIESLLFLSMLPLHNDNLLRQKAMYLNGIVLLNEIVL